MQSFYYKSFLYSSFKQYWVIESSKSIVEKIEHISCRANAKAILTFEKGKEGNKNSWVFLVIQFFRVISLIIYISLQQTLAKDSKDLIKCSHSEVRNLAVLQIIGIPMVIDPSHFWDNLYLSKHECDFISKLIKKDFARAKKFHGIFQFIFKSHLYTQWWRRISKVIQKSLP